MKHIWLCFLLAGMAAFTACDKDDDFLFDPDLMHFDGANSTAPVLIPGISETAVQFDREVLKNYKGRRIDAIRYYIYELPDEAELIIYGAGSDNRPGSILYDEPVTALLKPQQWNVIELSSPLSIPDNELWVSIKMQVSQPTQVIGCDAGPRVEGGDWITDPASPDWQTFLSLTSGPGTTPERINWNIRASIVD